ncbi:AAA family ATPase [Nocardia cyriacigeorgica]|uniref:phosphatase domain-containing protein n=1 Tax=Nocardia cyriacigeorgica TaxID=135487 RepID=UPI001895518C|nr:AAA family ATPase [Nocardia cyriacigeorgica]MBF6326559.1 AAA family ATPase [Nocardia cyriacigeorgica]
MSIEQIDVIAQSATRPKVIVPRGYPGAGKSTLFAQLKAADPKLARVSRDDARVALFGESGRLDFEKEQIISKAEKAHAEALIDAGYSVFVDAMNLRAQWVRGWANFAALRGAEFEIIDLDTTVDECVRRDAARGAADGRSVGEDAIRGLARKYPRKRWPKIEPSPDLFFYPRPWAPDESLPGVWVSDIDGTVARMTGRNPYDFARVHEDVPIEHTATVLRRLAVHNPIIMLSGRGDDCRDVTEQWLRDNDIPFTELFMRAADDKRPDYLVKYELFDTHLRGRFNVLGLFDDRLSVCRMWDRLGVPLMRLGRPDHDDF